MGVVDPERFVDGIVGALSADGVPVISEDGG
jgi:hypothetical protein